jgi:hypothetical protein
MASMDENRIVLKAFNEVSHTEIKKKSTDHRHRQIDMTSL